MHPRHTLQDQFSTFAWFENDTFRSWKGEPRLRKSMAQVLATVPQYAAATPENERFWALSWHRQWRDRAHPWAEQHLLAYLQEPCYWAAQEVSRKRSGQFGAPSTSPVSDYFQMAIAEAKPALDKFQADQSSNLKAFAQVFLSYRLKAALRRRREADFCTPWGLLRKTSKKLVLEALRQAGLKPPEVEEYRLLWMGFQALYIQTQPNNTAKLPEPDLALWEAIAQFYNQKRTGQLSHGAPSLTAAQVQARLQQLAQWARQYIYPTVQSLNTPQFGDDDAGEERLNNLSQAEQRSLMDDLIEQDLQAQRDRQSHTLQQLLLDAFRQLDRQTQTVLCLLYHHGLSQQAVRDQLKISQPTVCRRLKAGRQALIQAILNWMDDRLNKTPDPEQLNSITIHLEVWLKVSLPELNLCEQSEPPS